MLSFHLMNSKRTDCKKQTNKKEGKMSNSEKFNRHKIDKYEGFPLLSWLIPCPTFVV